MSLREYRQFGFNPLIGIPILQAYAVAPVPSPFSAGFNPLIGIPILQAIHCPGSWSVAVIGFNPLIGIPILQARDLDTRAAGHQNVSIP